MTFTTGKAKGPGRQSEALLETTSKPADSKSTATHAQYRRIIKALRLSPKTSHDLRCIGVYHPCGRIKELIDKFGYLIESERVTLWDRDGFAHKGCARYTLLREPENADALIGGAA